VSRGFLRNSRATSGAKKLSTVLAVPGVTLRRSERGSIGQISGNRPASVMPASRSRCSVSAPERHPEDHEQEHA